MTLRKIIKIVANQMTDFKATMHQIRFRLGLRPMLGSLQRSPDPQLDLGATSQQGEGLGWGEERKGEGKGREGKWREGKEGPKLLLNQGPSEPCYATVKRR